MPHTSAQKTAYRKARRLSDPDYAEKYRAQQQARNKRRYAPRLARRQAARPTTYCKNPACSKPIQHSGKRGKPRTYCNEDCRNVALYPTILVECAHCEGTGKVSVRACRVCGSRLPAKDKRRTICDAPQCRAYASTASGKWRSGWSSGNGGRTGKDYRAAVAVVKRRALDGEGCYFCGDGFIWSLPKNDRAAFTAHHLDALMHGNPAVVDPSRMAPAHRGCNSADGLRQLNARKAAARQARP